MGDRPIALIGLMATGKSTVGRAVADALGRRFVDSDGAILERTGRTVRELWDDGGEAAYRPLERDVTVDALTERPVTVVGVPGGAALDPAVQAVLADAFVVWLRARPETLAARVRPDDHRPLLQPDPLAAFRNLAAARADAYAALADVTVDVDDASPEHLARVVTAAATAAAAAPVVHAGRAERPTDASIPPGGTP
jgi:shikimate kinase